jgi:hypothetical protein
VAFEYFVANVFWGFGEFENRRESLRIVGNFQEWFVFSATAKVNPNSQGSTERISKLFTYKVEWNWKIFGRKTPINDFKTDLKQ